MNLKVCCVLTEIERRSTDERPYNFHVYQGGLTKDEKQTGSNCGLGELGNRIYTNDTNIVLVSH